MSSFRFTDDPSVDRFTPAFIEALGAPMETWQALQWHRFKTALADSTLRPWVHIITSRGHSPTHVANGLQEAIEMGFLSNSPATENIKTVSYKYGRTAHLDNLSAKIDELSRYLDWIERHEPVTRHYYEYSDDSKEGYIDPMVEFVARTMRTGKWKKIDVLFVHSTKTEEKVWLIRNGIIYKNAQSARYSINNLQDKFSSIICKTIFKKN